MSPLRALLDGLGLVARAPLVLAGVLLVTMAGAIPFGLVMGSRLQTALADQPPVMLGSEEIDADWWLEFRRHAEGLEATFTPTVIGFAAPLDNLSALLDGTVRPWAMALPIAIAIVTWAFLWGALIQRFRTDGRRGVPALVASGWRFLPPFVLISAAAAIVQVVLYLTVHRVLFGPVFNTLAAMVPQERDAFAIRLVLYGVFGTLLVGVGLVADYTRISLALGRGDGVSGALATALAFLRRSWRPVGLLFVMTAGALAVLLVFYGVGEAYGGSRVAGWRGVAIGQAFVVVRLLFRLLFVASEVRLFERASAAAR